MMNLLRNKKLVLGIIIAVAIFGIYELFFSGPSAPAPISPSAGPQGAPVLGGGLVSEISVSPADEKVGRDLLLMLAELKSTTLDQTFFSDPGFIALKDFSVTIASQPVGKKNPFAPFAGGSTGTTIGSQQPSVSPGASPAAPLRGGRVGP